MGYKVRLQYPSGETEELDEVFDSWESADSEGMEQANAFAVGGDVLEDAGRDFASGSLEWEVYEE